MCERGLQLGTETGAHVSPCRGHSGDGGMEDKEGHEVNLTNVTWGDAGFAT